MVFGKKKQPVDDIPEDEQKSARFSSKKQQRPSFTNTNPYAAGGSDPYAAAGPDPYAPRSSAPPPYAGNDQGGFDRYRQEKTPVPPGGYGGGLPSGPRAGSAPPVGSSRYGNSSGNSYSGYGGEDRYGTPSGPPAGQSRYGTSGYGGLGVPPPSSQTSENPDEARNALFGSAATKYSGTQNNAYASNNYDTNKDFASNRYGSAANQTAVDEWNSGKGPGYGQDSSQGYGTDYSQRELTAEEQEEEEVSAAKQEIRAIKQQDVSSTRNALRIAQQAEETGRSTLERLGAQGERIYNTERNLDLASNQNRLAAEKARELKTLNRSMFAVHVANPFTSKQRTLEHEQKVLEQAKSDRDQRDATRAAAWSTNARAQKAAMALNKPSGGPKKTSLAERSKYQFEADSEDEQMEDEIDNNLDLLHGAAGRLKQLGLAMGEEVDAQNTHIERIGGKVDKVDDEIALNRSRLDRIR